MIGQKLADRYEIQSELGRGGMGVVYRAHDPVLNRDVAVKVIAPSMLTPETEQRFQTEAQVVAGLDHPAIVSIHDFGRHEGSLFFVMPIVEGTSLRQLIRDESLRLGEIVDVGIGVAEALDYSQGRGIVHRDIKPENIMANREEAGGLRVRVMDFGLARASEVSRITKTGMMVGTMSYISPEQVSGKPVDTRSDIYSLGTVLYECAAGDVPFSGEAQAVLYRVLHENPQSPRERGADIDPELDDIILQCLEKAPDKRPQKAAEVIRSLRSYRNKLRDSERNKSVMVTRVMQAARPALAPFVGREEESKEIQKRLNTAINGECQFVAVSGEAGIGKTRLLDELESLARARQIRVLHGRFVEQDGAFPYHGFCEAIQEYFRQKETGTSSSSGMPDFSDLGGELVSLFPMLSEIEAIRTTSGAGPRPGTTSSATPEGRTQIFELLAKTLTRLAGGKPLVLLFEDLHGAEVSIEALQYIVRRLGPTPTLLVGTYRSTEIDRRHSLARMLDAFRGDRRFAHLELGPFSHKEHREFLATLIGDAEFAEDVAERLYEGTKGNPFFTKELVRSLLDAGSIAQDDTGEWSFSGTVDISSEVLPATIQQAVEERLSRLPEDMREILSIAAVMGKSFDFGDLEKLAEDKGDLDDAVESMIAAGLIEEERQSRGDTLAFTSGVVREVLYADLSRRKRRSVHRKYAARLEKRHAGKLERIYPQLVYHCAEGDLPEKTVEYGLLHARKSMGTFSPEEAIRSVSTALDFLDDEWEGDGWMEGEARMLLAGARRMQGDTEAALKDIAAAVAVFEKEGRSEQTVEALLAAARTAWQARLPVETNQWVERGTESARNAGDDERLGQFLSLAATLANLKGEYDKAGEYLKEAERLGAASRGDAGQKEISRGGKLVVALINPVTATEPSTMEILEEWEVFSNVIDTLVSTDDQGNLVPSLCEKWELQDGGRSFILELRDGVRFQDGHDLTAETVKASFEAGVRAAAGNLAPAFTPIRGVADFIEGKAGGIEGIEILGDGKLVIHLDNPLPIYPALLADERASIYRCDPEAPKSEGASLIGTGAFRLVSRDDKQVLLERNDDYWKGTPPYLDAVDFRHGLTAADVAAGLKSGEIDVGGDLHPQDLEEILRDPRLRGGLAEAPKSTTYFLMFNALSGVLAENEAARQALTGLIRPEDLVWRTVGRFAHPAVGLLPPGMLGHDPGKRRRPLSVEQAREQLAAAGVTGLELRAAVHPVIKDRFGVLVDALFSTWVDLGVKVSVNTTDLASFMKAWADGEGFDMGLMRWAPDYNDPDDFTHNLFYSQTGQLRTYYSSSEADKMLTAARAETRPSMRTELYRKFENLLLEAGILLPLFHDVDYRIAHPTVRGLEVRSKYPAVNYAEIGKGKEAGVPEARQAGGIIRVPLGGQFETFDPALVGSVEDNEIIRTIFETLTRMHEAEGRIQPWLAQSYSTEDGGKKYRFQLRPDVLFHNGRRLTARDVRFSFERLLNNPTSVTRWNFVDVVGARDVIEGRRKDLAGFQIHSATEFTMELERPLSIFPVLLSDVSAAVVPEGTGAIKMEAGKATGTGPFRLVRAEGTQIFFLERNATYWRAGYPRSDQLEFHTSIPPREILAGFEAGRFSLGADLIPDDVDALRRQTEYAAGYREEPSLSTYYAAFNVKEGPLADRDVRRSLVRGIDIDKVVQQTLGGRAVPAKSWIPPGLIEHGAGARSGILEKPKAASGQVKIAIGVHPIFTAEYAAFLNKFVQEITALGMKTEIVQCETAAELIQGNRDGRFDLTMGRWYADYPDADSFAHCLQSQEGDIGRTCGLDELDRLIEKGRTEVNPAVRHDIYRQFEDVLFREAVMLPLFHEQVYRIARPDVEGLTVTYHGNPTVLYETLRVKQ